METESLQGWTPNIGGDLTIEKVIDLAFDYRGNTTIVKNDGSEFEGYLSNRNSTVADPFVQAFDAKGNGPFRIPYSEIKNIRFTGRDTAAGKSWAAWVKRKNQEKTAPNESCSPIEPN